MTVPTQITFTGSSGSVASIDANFAALWPLLSYIAPGTSDPQCLRFLDSDHAGWRMSTLSVGGSNHQLAFKYQGGNTFYGIGFLPEANNTNALTFANAANAPVGSVYCTSTATAYNTSSDRRLKTGIVPAADAGSTLDAIQVVQHGWLADSAVTVRWGFVAQDLATVMPEAVTEGDDNPDTVEHVWSVDPSKLVALLVKEVQALRARVAALEAA